MKANPIADSSTISGRWARSAGQSRLRCGQANGKQDQKDAEPADRGQRDRRHVVADMARQHDVAGPEQTGQAEQEIGLVVEPSGPGRRRAALVRVWSSVLAQVVPDSCRATSPVPAMLQCP